VAPITVDTARQASLVSQSLLQASQAQLDLTKQKVSADLKTANSSLIQSKRVVESAKASLKSAQGEVYATAARHAEVGTAAAASRVAAANLNSAIGNLTTNSINRELVAQALQAQKVASQQVVISATQWGRSFIKTPIQGTVLQMAAQQGETVAASLAAPTLIVVTDLARLEVEAYVDETDIGKIRLGQPAQVSVDAFPNQAFMGTVSKIAAGLTIQVGVITYDVTISIQDPLTRLRPDMSATTTIETGRQKGTLLVPAVAIQATLNGSFIKVLMVRDGKKQVVSVPVKTGGTDGVNVSIVSGLMLGDQIVLAGAKTAPGATRGSSAFGGGGGGRGGH
jgi:RND family efflux transporter MFP subunit